jgi:hypothetical protein
MLIKKSKSVYRRRTDNRCHSIIIIKLFKNVTKYYIENNIQILTLILKTKNRHNTVHWLPGPRLNRTISDLSYDHLPTMFATVSQNLSECFYDFRFVVMTSSLCGGTKINQFNRAAHLSDKFIRSNKILNIKYSYFIGLCRYKSCDTLRK